MYGQLIPVGGGPPLPLLEPSLVLGRAPECDLVIAGKSVSGRHCELQFIDGHWWVKDLGSHNGTGVNGKRCTHRQIAPNDILWVAKQRFRVSYLIPGQKEADEDFAADLLTEQVEPSKPVPLRKPTLQTRAPVAAQHTMRHHALTPRPQRVQVLGRLVPCGGGDPIPLLREDLLVGRKSSCDIQLRFANISAQHCRLFLEKGYWFVEDLNSRNGVKVDGMRVHRKALAPATIVSIANHRYTIEYTPTGLEPLPDEDPFAQSLLVKAGLERQVETAALPDWAEDDDRPPRRPKKGPG